MSAAQEKNRLSIDEFAAALLTNLGYWKTQSNINFIRAWQQAENSNFFNNPLSTSQPMLGATGVFIKNYIDFNQGVQATAITLKNGYYPHILALLDKGREIDKLNSKDYAELLHDLTTWGTGELVKEVYIDYFKDKDVNLEISKLGAPNSIIFLILFGLFVIFNS